MRRLDAFLLALFLLLAASAPAANTCVPPVELSPMPGFSQVGCESWEWDEVEFLVDYDTDRYRTIRGAHWELRYEMPEDTRQQPGTSQVVRNIAGALAPLGGRVVWRTADKVLVRLLREGSTIWVLGDVYNDGLLYTLSIVQEAPLHQDMVAEAGALMEGLRTDGHATLTGIHFDLDSDRLRPESDAALSQAAKLLSGNPALKLWVVGHTDATGSFEHNLDLSRRRAAAVVRALVERFGIAPSRLEAHGVGPLAPVATNATEEGRKLNRRVELVAR